MLNNSHRGSDGESISLVLQDVTALNIPNCPSVYIVTFAPCDE